jgi:histidine triad (HIT) family protein
MGGVLPDDYTGHDFYCDVALPNVDALDVVHEDDRVLAFRHTKPFYDVHVMVVPKRHIASLTTATADDEADLRALFTMVQRVAAEIERDHGGARVVTNIGKYQDSKHLHVHVVSGSVLQQEAQVRD